MLLISTKPLNVASVTACIICYESNAQCVCHTSVFFPHPRNSDCFKIRKKQQKTMLVKVLLWFPCLHSETFASPLSAVGFEMGILHQARCTEGCRVVVSVLRVSARPRSTAVLVAPQQCGMLCEDVRCQRGVRELNAAGLGWICTSCSVCTSGKEEQIAGIWCCFSRLKSCSGFGVVC